VVSAEYQCPFPKMRQETVTHENLLSDMQRPHSTRHTTQIQLVLGIKKSK